MKHNKSFHAVNDEVEDALIQLSNVVNAKQRLWQYLVRHMSLSNRVVLAQTSTAKELGYSRQTIHRCLKEFTFRGLIVLDGKSQNNNIYMLNPEKVFRGKLDTIDRYVAKFAVLRGDITGD